MKTEESNTIIAEYMGCPYIVDGTLRYWLVDGRQTSTLRYDISIEWLYPVYLRLRKELTQVIGDNVNKGASAHWTLGKAGTVKASIELALLDGNIHELHAEIVKGITFLNEQKK